MAPTAGILAAAQLTLLAPNIERSCRLVVVPGLMIIKRTSCRNKLLPRLHCNVNEAFSMQISMKTRSIWSEQESGA